jgi:hypothetical protein
VIWFGYGLVVLVTSSGSSQLRLALLLVLSAALAVASAVAWKRSLAYFRADAAAGGAVIGVLRSVACAVLIVVIPSASAAGAVFLILIFGLVLVGMWVPYEHPVE